MFTGIIAEVGKIERVSARGGGRQLRIAAPAVSRELQEGDSVAVNGACLTVERAGDGWFEVFAGAETCRRTTLGQLGPGAAVNLEPALKAGQPLGGHIVHGHVDGIGWLRRVRSEGETIYMAFEAPGELLEEIVPRGSVAVDGISLTVTEVNESSFSVAIIPFTWEHTNLRYLRAGDAVNIETDILAKYVRRFVGALDQGRGGIDMEFLRRHGYA